MHIRDIGVRAISIFIVICTLLSISCAAAPAKVIQSSDYINDWGAKLSVLSGGKIGVYVDVSAVKVMTSIGASKVVIYESQDGVNFSPVKTYYASEYSEMLGSGGHYRKVAVTHSGTVGYKYYANVVCYASNSSGSDSRECTTDIVTARK